MRHKWTKQPDETILGQTYKVWLCNMCGCKKKLANMKYAEPNYHRSMQIYTEYIECFDIEAENLKTID